MFALSISLLPDLGRKWQPLGLTDEGWRQVRLCSHKQIYKYNKMKISAKAEIHHNFTLYTFHFTLILRYIL